MDIPYHTLDVFTDRVFGGNPLAVFPDARALGEATMQRIAREMNLSESVFLLPPETPGGTRRARIFTPAVELPFAGHPTVGAAFFLAASGSVPARDGGFHVVLEENVGPVPVEVLADGGRPVSARLTAPVPPEHRDAPFPAAELAALLTLPDGAVGGDGLDPEFVSCGQPFLVVPVRDLEAARKARLDPPTWGRLLKGAWSRKVYVVCPEAEGPGADLHVRMFAPDAGIPEDPATGAAAAALGAYLGRRSGFTDGTLSWRAEQGLEIGRPSLLEVDARLEGGRVTRVRVGGGSVLVGRGVLELPDGEAAS